MLTVLGDIHGKYDQMHQLKLQDKYVVQVGDLGFDYDYIADNYDPDKFKVVLGNHDCYDSRPINYDLGDYGTRTLNGVPFFFLRGSFSIDCLIRVVGFAMNGEKTWWYEEQLSDEELDKAFELFVTTRPEVVITHDCPEQIKPFVSNPSVMQTFGWPVDYSCRTQQALGKMFDAHKPKLWLFGHYHRTVTLEHAGTTFQCLDELATVNVERKGSNYIVTAPELNIDYVC